MISEVSRSNTLMETERVALSTPEESLIRDRFASSPKTNLPTPSELRNLRQTVVAGSTPVTGTRVPLPLAPSLWNAPLPSAAPQAASGAVATAPRSVDLWYAQTAIHASQAKVLCGHRA